MMKFWRVEIFVFFVVMVFCGCLFGGDWSTYRGDNQRSGVSAEGLDLPLSALWTCRSLSAPAAAWPQMPAKADFWAYLGNLSHTNTYDRAFHVAISGENIYFGSSVDDTVYCLDSKSGKTKWTFVTEGPVRLAPALAKGKVYVGSDDGCVYCLDALNGDLVWRYRPAANRRILGNGRMISRWPVRSGIVVEDGKVYFTCGIFPAGDVFLCVADAATGREILKKKIDISPQGYMLSSSSRLYIPTGRTAANLFDKATGQGHGEIGSGGCFAIVQDDMFISGPDERGNMSMSTPDTKERIARSAGYEMIAKGEMTYMLKEGNLSALKRKEYIELNKKIGKLRKIKERTEEQKLELDTAKAELAKCLKWSVDCSGKYSMIIAGSTLFVGGEGSVVGYDAKTGEKVWQGEIQGKAYGLAAANGQLVVSTDNGSIHCFGKGSGKESKTVAAITAAYPKSEKSPLYVLTAETIKKNIDFDKGYCLVLGAEKGELVYELAMRTNFQIIGVESDKKKVDEARKLLRKTGLYGKRVVMHHGSLDKLPYPGRFANLITSDGSLLNGKIGTDAVETWRMVRPCGGVVAIGVGDNGVDLLGWGMMAIPGWRIAKVEELTGGIARRGALEGSGEWTHTYGDAGNSACSQDELVSSDIELQWFGSPGPREMIDRHHRNVPPLYKDGRLFIPGDNIVYCVDAYNGTMLWDVRIEDSRRLGVFLDAGSMAVDDEVLYVAKGDGCLRFDVRTGKKMWGHTMPQLVFEEDRHWGYLAYVDDVLFGSGRRKGASYTQTSRAADNELWYNNMKVVTSDFLFANNRKSGSEKWTYKDGLILNPTITIGDGQVFFIETTSPKAMADEVGRMPIKTLFDGGEQNLVALDMRTGKVNYKKAIDTSNFEEPVFLNYSRCVLILNGSRLIGKAVTYHVDAFDAKNGKRIWEVTHNSGLARDGGHGEYNRHPTIVRDTVFVWPYAYDLKTGLKDEEWKFNRHGHGCGGVSASNFGLFWRGQNPYMYDLNPGKGAMQISKVTRPGCWINIIPAGGMVLIPEASSGCTCGHSIQTSLGYITKIKNDN